MKSDIEGLAQGLKWTTPDPSISITVEKMSIAIESKGVKNRAFDEPESQKTRDLMTASFSQK